MHALLVEDDPVSAAAVEFTLQRENFECDSTALGKVAVLQARLCPYDILILDLGLPDVDGSEVLHQLRAAGVKTPVLILSGLTTVDDKVKGLRLGADDFLTKPFAPGELIARIRAIIRRSIGHSASEIRTGELVLNLDSRTAAIGNRPLDLTPKEYAVLELLSLRKGTALAKQYLLQQLYPGLHEPGIKIIDVFVSRLRRKLTQASGGEPYIETVQGRGFVLRDFSGTASGEADSILATKPSRYRVRSTGKLAA
jgi:two-component system, cell cycle response regulator CtrA